MSSEGKSGCHVVRLQHEMLPWDYILESIYLNGSDWYEGGVFKHPKQYNFFNSYGLFKISIKKHP